jgi:hypothetical protein
LCNNAVSRRFGKYSFHLDSKQLFSADPTIIKKQVALKKRKLKKTPSKVAQKYSIFLLYCPELPKQKNSCSKMWLIDLMNLIFLKDIFESVCIFIGSKVTTSTVYKTGEQVVPFIGLSELYT